MKKYLLLCFLVQVLACERLDDNSSDRTDIETPAYAATLTEVAELFSTLPIGSGQMAEVADAVRASSVNGYDEEYTMKNLFESPGAGVGDEATKGSGTYEEPLRDLVRAAAEQRYATKGSASAEDFLEMLSSSDIQIYWPYSDLWDGKTLPVITSDPMDDALRNVGYTLDGREVVVDEEMAKRRPVWVINGNRDAAYKTLELLRREDPDWGSGGGTVLVKSGGLRTLVLKSFRANRNYDSWFSGASEFFVKCGSVDGFNARTEAELAVYSPTITDFMIVVRRSELGETLPFNAILVSEWTDSIESCAFLVVEDDGGSRTSWKCSAAVKYNSKTYGFDIEIPLYTKDDICWRGQLTSSFIEKYSGKEVAFGNLDLVLELI